jgi:hypothetical protein
MFARMARSLSLPALVLGVSAVLAAGASAQFRTVADDRWCAQDGGWDEGEQHCEVREMTFPASQLVSVDSSPNGGIQVEGWDRNELRVQARIVARADTEEEARSLAAGVTIETQGTIRAEGPAGGRGRKHWYVSYRLNAPRGARLNLSASNGGIAIRDFDGAAEFRTVNGGVKVTRAAGHIQGRTSNGGVNVELHGTEWKGEGLDVQTTNGGVKLAVPEDYNAQLETGTVNGGLDLRFPLTVQGQVKKRINVTLGRGGAPVRAITTNGGVVIGRP